MIIQACATTQRDAAGPNERAVAEADYVRIKSLEGDWYLVGGERLGKPVEPDAEAPFLTYEISSGGHAVIEKLYAGKPNEMISVYYLDMGRLNMDHYCSLGNQPRMVAVPAGDDFIEFQLVGISNHPDENALHISSHTLEFDGPDALSVYWGATEDQVPFDGSVYHVKRTPLP